MGNRSSSSAIAATTAASPTSHHVRVRNLFLTSNHDGASSTPILPTPLIDIIMNYYCASLPSSYLNADRLLVRGTLHNHRYTHMWSIGVNELSAHWHDNINNDVKPYRNYMTTKQETAAERERKGETSVASETTECQWVTHCSAPQNHIWMLHNNDPFDPRSPTAAAACSSAMNHLMSHRPRCYEEDTVEYWHITHHILITTTIL
jgi:hypothetical protein